MLMNIILLLLGLIVIVYLIVPNYYFRNLSKKIVRKIESPKKEIALTFDDGPDAKYTNDLLDILKKYEVKCTFFLIAEKALKNKNIFQRMVKEGHVVALHSLNHRSAWLSSPWQTKKDFQKSLKIFESLGYELKLTRPPWGTFNLFTQYYAEKHHLQTILWSLNAQDWSRKTTSEEIIEKIVDRVTAGDIIVLHDSNGAQGAPARTLKAVDVIIPQLQSSGFEFVTINQKVGAQPNDQIS